MTCWGRVQCTLFKDVTFSLWKLLFCKIYLSHGCCVTAKSSIYQIKHQIFEVREKMLCRVVNQKQPGFWWKMAGIHFSISDKWWLKLSLKSLTSLDGYVLSEFAWNVLQANGIELLAFLKTKCTVLKFLVHCAHSACIGRYVDQFLIPF